MRFEGKKAICQYKDIISSLQMQGSGLQWWSQSEHLAPKMMATSALARARERAALAQRGWASGTTPLPMAVAKNGSPKLSMSAVRALSA